MRDIIYRHILIVGVFLSLLFCGSSTVSASQEIFEADGYYELVDGMGESFASARERAKSQAMQKASDYACAFIESISESNKGVLTKDEISAISSSILQIKGEPQYTHEVVGENKILVHCHITAVVDSSNVMEALQKDRKSLHDAVQQNKALEVELARINRENEELKAKYAAASDERQRQLVREEKSKNDQYFQSMVYLEIASQTLRKGNVYDAINFLMESTQKYPENLRAWTSLVDCCKMAIKINTKDKNVWNLMGISYLKLNEYDKAIEPFTKALEIDQKSENVWFFLGVAYQNMKNYDKAIECYTKELVINPRDEQVYYHRGTVYFVTEQYEKAKLDFKKVYELNPNHRDIADIMKMAEKW